MTNDHIPQDARKKTPGDASEFEREQLRFLLSDGDVTTTLATINPSLAWLPVLQQMRLIQNGHQLANWIERNFTDSNAIRDVVENLQFFNAQIPGLLEVSIGHALISDALYFGLENTVQLYKRQLHEL